MTSDAEKALRLLCVGNAQASRAILAIFLLPAWQACERGGEDDEWNVIESISWLIWIANLGDVRGSRELCSIKWTHSSANMRVAFWLASANQMINVKVNNPRTNFRRAGFPMTLKLTLASLPFYHFASQWIIHDILKYFRLNLVRRCQALCPSSLISFRFIRLKSKSGSSS